jgi:PST family polysaccharide transporter
MTLASTAFLARLLLPGDYGLMGMAVAVTNFANMYRDLGTSSAVVQRKELSQELLSTVLWANVGIGFGLMCLVGAASTPAAYYFKEPRLIPILCVLAPTFLLAGCSTVHQALLQREMEFARLARVEILSAGFAVAVTLSAATLGWGVWSLLAQTLANSLCSATLLWQLSRWRPSAAFVLNELKSVWGYSLNLTGFSSLNYFIRNGDTLIIGHFLGTQNLGYYSMASKIMLYPLVTISGLVGRTLFPALSKAQHDNAALQRGYLKAVGFIALATFPILAGLMATAQPAVTTFLSAKWRPIVPLLLVLCPLGMVQSVLTTTGNVMMAKGRTDLMLRLGVYSSLATVAAFLIGIHWGLLGLCAAYLLVELLNAPFWFFFALRQIQAPLRALVRPIRGPLICSGIMAITVAVTAAPIASVLGVRAGLAASVVEGVLIYLAANWALNRPQAREFLHTLLWR